MKAKETLTLMDDVHAWTFLHKHDGRALKHGEYGVQQKLRNLLRQAQRFVLDDDAIRLVCDLSHEFDRLPYWALLARLPFDVMWVEVDLHAKVRKFHEMNTLKEPMDLSQVAPLAGYLLFREDPGSQSPRWCCNEFYRIPDVDGGCSPGFFNYVFDPEGDPKFPIRGSSYWKSPTLSLRPNFPKMPVTIQAAGGITIMSECDPELAVGGVFNIRDTTGRSRGGTMHGANEDLHLDEANGTVSIQLDDVYKDKHGNFHTASIIETPDWFNNRIAVTIDPWYERYLSDRAKDDLTRWQMYMIHELHELRGVLRWLMTLLAAINALPRDVRPVHSRVGKRAIGMNQIPYLHHNRPTITLPRDDRTVYARRALDRASHTEHRKRHRVRGHWRVVERGRRVNYLCRHLPVLMEGGLAICEKCEMLVRWIEEHRRGDASLGWVEHDEYAVTARKQAPRVELGLHKEPDHVEDGGHQRDLSDQLAQP